MENESFNNNNFKKVIETNPERQREIARQGGIASGRVRRKKAQQKKALSTILEAAYMVDFATPEELQEFRRWKRRRKKK